MKMESNLTSLRWMVENIQTRREYFNTRLNEIKEENAKKLDYVHGKRVNKEKKDFHISAKYQKKTRTDVQTDMLKKEKKRVVNMLKLDLTNAVGSQSIRVSISPGRSTISPTKNPWRKMSTGLTDLLESQNRSKENSSPRSHSPIAIRDNNGRLLRLNSNINNVSVLNDSEVSTKGAFTFKTDKSKVDKSDIKHRTFSIFESSKVGSEDDIPEVILTEEKYENMLVNHNAPDFMRDEIHLVAKELMNREQPQKEILMMKTLKTDVFENIEKMAKGNFHERITSQKEKDVFEGISQNLIKTLYSRGGYGLLGPQLKSRLKRPGSVAVNPNTKPNNSSKPTNNTNNTQNSSVMTEGGLNNKSHRSRSLQNSPSKPSKPKPIDSALAAKKRKVEELDIQMKNKYGARSKLFDYEIALMSRQNRMILVMNKNERVKVLAEREKHREKIEEEKRKKIEKERAKGLSYYG